MQKGNNTKGARSKVSEVVHQGRAMWMKIRTIEIVYVGVSLIEVTKSAEELNRLGANWDIVGADNVRCY